MGSRRESVAGRARWITVFALLLLACSAVPVLAAEQTEAPPPGSVGFIPPTGEEEEIAAAQIPDAQDVSKALAEAEREEAEHEKWLASPEASEQREASWLAFGELSAAESEDLLRTLFAEQLAILNSDPSRFLSDAQLVRPIGDSGAVVKDEGDGSLLESPVPVRTEDEGGDLAKVDLTLEATPEGFRTVNAIAELVLPGSADEAIRVGEDGFEIAQAGAAESPAAASATRTSSIRRFCPTPTCSSPAIALEPSSSTCCAPKTAPRRCVSPSTYRQEPSSAPTGAGERKSPAKTSC